MYHGIVQHGSYMTPYLKEQTLERGLDLPVHLGRIWRVVPEDWKPEPFPKLAEESNSELISRLSHPDGWHRDIAQRLLVERNDPTSIEDLVTLAKSGGSEMGRFHSLWTLEGMNALNSDLLFETLEDQNSLIKNTSLRLLEPFAQSNSETLNKLETKMAELSKTSDVTVGLQLAMSSASLSEEASAQVLASVLNSFGDQALIQDAVMSSLSDREYGFLARLWESPNWENSDQNKEIFLETLTAAIMKKGDNPEIKALLALVGAGDSELNWKQETVLVGMAIQTANSQKQTPALLAGEPDLFKRTDLPIDQNRLNGLKRRFSWPGYVPEAVFVSASSLDEKAQIQFADGRKKYLVSCAGCHGSNGKGVQRMAPPLVASDWVLGDERRLVLIILHGIEGPIEVDGKKYYSPEILPVMPSHSTMDDASIAAILTYVRNEWGNQAPAISRGLVSGTRHTSQGRVYPWSPVELNKHIESLAEPKTE
jgi:mono/diheme cytochrome c family protein